MSPGTIISYKRDKKLEKAKGTFNLHQVNIHIIRIHGIY